MSRQRLLSLYGLKWNPFAPDVPVEGLLATPSMEHFAWRVEQLVPDGGFALISGDPGTGKSVALRILADRLGRVRDAVVGVLSRPQSGVPDFYRELGEVFSVKLSPHNRWGGFKVLRERWKSHVESSLLRPVLLIDEAQAMAPGVLSELRILSSAHFDTQHYLTVVLAGDSRLIELFRHEDLVPLASRIRTRLAIDYAPRQDLKALLAHTITQAGNAKLMTSALMDTLAEHAAGNCRVLMSMAGELLIEGMSRERDQLDEKLYLEVFNLDAVRREPQRREKVRS
jgi:general secretion pathway protein A